MGRAAMRKKVWSKPKLVVLVRGRPEEAILNGCKVDLTEGPNNSDLYCKNEGGRCLACSTLGGS